MTIDVSHVGEEYFDHATFSTANFSPAVGKHDHDVVFHKTMAGHREFELRNKPLRAELRRLLILIDGKRSARLLGQCFRSGDIFALLEELRHSGLISASKCCDSFATFTADDALADVAPMSHAQFEAVRGVAMHAAAEMLGSASFSSRLALSLCEDRRALRAILTELESQLVAAIGRDAATLFFATVRDASTAASPTKIAS